MPPSISVVCWFRTDCGSGHYAELQCWKASWPLPARRTMSRYENDRKLLRFTERTPMLSPNMKMPVHSDLASTGQEVPLALKIAAVALRSAFLLGLIAIVAYVSLPQ